ncbi:MAG TPA: hypothetical protein VLF59_02750 [Candidatus Saccharimonadales bacterium]|nr:hypothetical protein [Candidatus Saccharimonadales bacterium]
MTQWQGALHKLRAVAQFYGKPLSVLFITLPALATLSLIVIFGRTVPFWDEWELVPILQHVHAGHWILSDFWQQHNGHRLLFPTIALVLLIQLSHWNMLFLCLVSFAIAAAAYSLVYATLRLGGNTNRVPFGVGFLSALVWFSPAQVENWLWAWQLEWFMNVLGVMLVVYGLARAQTLGIGKRAVTFILVGAVLAEYSLGNGMLLWPLAILAVSYLRTSWVKLSAIIAAAAVSTGIYFMGYTNASESSQHLALTHPLQFSDYLLTYLGSPLVHSHKAAFALGLVLVVAFMMLCAYLLVQHRERFRQAIPWIVLGLYSMGTAVLTGLARLNFGVGEALASRYITMSSLLLISTLMICFVAHTELRILLKRGYVPLRNVAVTVLACVLLTSATWGVHAFHTRYYMLRTTHICTSVPDPTDACLSTTYPVPALARPRLQYLKSLHWAGY